MNEEEEEELKITPCPFCGGTDLSFEYNMSQGHGDCGFSNGRIQCETCSGSKGKGYGYGHPTGQDELKAWVQWNDRIIKP